jgi:F-type H+-transporting ATPase subunit b
MTSRKRTACSCFLALLLMSCLGLGAVRAQEPAASPQHQPSDSAQPSVSAGREAAQESREAEEKRAEQEKDEAAGFKQSASVKLLAKLTGLSLQQSYWLSVILNFAVIASIIVWAGRKYLPGMFRNRSAAIQRAMREAQKASEEARRKMGEIESRLRKLDVEIGMMRDAAEGEAAEEEARIQAAAEEDGRRIVASAEQEIAAAAKAARRQLTTHAASLAVGLARKQIRVDAATDQALVRNFAGQLGAASDHPGKEGH